MKYLQDSGMFSGYQPKIQIQQEAQRKQQDAKRKQECADAHTHTHTIKTDQEMIGTHNMSSIFRAQ